MAAQRVLVVEHQESCPPALFGDWLAGAGAELHVARPYLGDDLPEPTTYDAVLVLGGEMGANDDDTVTWLGPLKAGIRSAVAAGVPLLGICLGHQLVAAALGGRVEPNPGGQTVGLQRLGWTEHAAEDPLFAGASGEERCVHWNGDVVTAAPEGTTVLASAPDGTLQAARFAPAAWGIQAHPEVDVEVCRRWAEVDREDHLARGVDQDALLATVEQAAAELAGHWRPLAERFAALAGGASWT
jgi:GMP synthase (glutamine-hydrolysing)